MSQDCCSDEEFEVTALDVPEHVVRRVGSARMLPSGSQLFIQLDCIPVNWKGRLLVDLATTKGAEE